MEKFRVIAPQLFAQQQTKVYGRLRNFKEQELKIIPSNGRLSDKTLAVDRVASKTKTSDKLMAIFNQEIEKIR